MKLILPILLLVGVAVGYNYALAVHGPAIFKALNGPKVNHRSR